VDLSYSYVTLSEVSDEVKASTPAHIASGRLLVPLADGEVHLATQITYQSARGSGAGGAESGEAVLLGLGLSGEFANFRYFAGVQNLLDERYVLPVSAETSLGAVPQYGRTFSLQLTGSF
jgi:outer membrane receptor for ferrienterochelin and colicins